MVREPKVSVLMSVYNGEKYLRKAMESILGQTFSDFEFIIFNDGSTDGTADIIYSYNDSRIVLVNNEKNMGLTKSLNAGIKIAKGKYIARMDADDISLSERFERQINYLEDHPEIILLGTDFHIIDESGQIMRTIYEPRSYDEIRIHLVLSNCFAHSSVIYNTSAVRQIGGYDETLPYTDTASDYNLWWRMSQMGRVENYPEVLICWRMNFSSGLTLTQSSNQRICSDTTALKAVRKFMDGEPIDEEAYLRLRHVLQRDRSEWNGEDARALRPLWHRIQEKSGLPDFLRQFLISWLEKLADRDKVKGFRNQAEGLLLLRTLCICFEEFRWYRFPTKLLVKLALGPNWLHYIRRVRRI